MPAIKAADGRLRWGVAELDGRVAAISAGSSMLFLKPSKAVASEPHNTTPISRTIQTYGEWTL